MPTSSPPVYNGRYELSHQIARGGTAQVYLARDLLLDRPVALKMLFPELSADRTFVDRFRREAQAAANLSHPNIVPIFDWGESDRTYYIVMEYVDGEPLSAIIRTQAPLDGAQAAGIAADIAKALSYAHRHGVVHRDVKPGNVLITSDGQVKVGDFGIARAIGSDENITQTGLVMGTATYFSPEQAQGLGVDGRSDVYSLGVVLFEMLTGRPPFTGETPISIAYQHVRETAPTPRSFNPNIPLTLEAIVLQAMAKQPSERYQTAQDFQADLQRWVQGGTVIVPDRDLAAPPRVAPPTDNGAGGAGGAGDVSSGAAGLTAVMPADRGTAATTVMSSATAAVAPRAAPAATGISAATTAIGSGVTTPPAKTGATRSVQGTPPLPKTRTLEWAGAATAVLVVIAVVAFFGGRALGYFGGKPWFPAPNLADMSLAQAKTHLSSDGLVLGPVTQGFNSAPVGYVYDQSPEPTSSVQTGAVVELFVSKGPQSAIVPSVVDLPLAPAELDLRNDGFKVSVSSEPAPAGSTVPQGHVFSEDPPANTLQTKGSTIALVVIQGFRKGEVPPIPVGDTQEQAINILDTAGFTVAPTTTPQTSATVATGDVIATQPAAGTTETLGSVVTLVVSSGQPPPQVVIPNVYGLTEAAATTKLTQAQFNVSDQLVTVCTANQNGLVQETNPAIGSSVQQGSPVTLEVGSYQPASTACATTTTSSTSTSVPTSTSSTSTTLPTAGTNAPAAQASGSSAVASDRPRRR
jgi:beta-lactam-binding protein with PASTA domain/tRNA A-37 threonylcarbamoyl transferase component Bud32